MKLVDFLAKMMPISDDPSKDHVCRKNFARTPRGAARKGAIIAKHDYPLFLRGPVDGGNQPDGLKSWRIRVHTSKSEIGFFPVSRVTSISQNRRSIDRNSASSVNTVRSGKSP